MPAWTPGIFSQVLQHQVAVFTPRTCVPLVCLVNMSHLSVANLQQHLWSSAPSRLFPSVALAVARTVSVKVWGDVCMCLSLDAEATGWLSGLLSCSEDRDTVFIYPSPSCHCCVWSEFAELRATLGELSNPPTLQTMQNATAQHTPWTLILENKSRAQQPSNVATFTEWTYLNRFCVRWNRGCNNSFLSVYL